MIRILELFAGIGAASKALTNLGIEHEIVDAVEIDKYAIKSFNAIHGTNFEPQDITKWDKDIECDLIVHGSPCQDFSIAGKQAGGDKDSGTRSSLMYETLRIVEKLKPKYVIWENVKNLLSAKHRPNFDAYQKAMEELGYENYYQVLNAKNYGVPQNRERVFTVSIRKDYPSYVYNKFREPFDFPQPIPLEKRLKDVLEPVVDEKYYLSDKQTERLRTTTFNQQKARYNTLDAVTPTLCARDYKDPQVVRLGGLYDGKTKHQAGSVYDPDGVSATLSTMQGGNQEPIIVDDIYKNRSPREYENESPTIRAGRHGLKVQEPFIVASRGRNPSNPSDRTAGAPTEQRLEPKFDGTSNTITSVQKDNYVASVWRYVDEPQVLTPKRTEYGKKIRKQYENHEIKEKRKNMQRLEPRDDGVSNTLTSVQKDNYVKLPGAYGRDFGSKGKIQDKNGVSSTMQAAMGEGGGNVPLINGVRIRKLTPTECWRLMGFTKEDCDKASQAGVSNSQLYKQAGNSIVVDVLMAIFKELLCK